MSKRTKFELLIGNYQRGILKGSKATSAVLTKRNDGTYYINIHVNHIVPEPKSTNKIIGIDLGRTDIASTSEGESWSGKNITSKRNHYSLLGEQFYKEKHLKALVVVGEDVGNYSNGYQVKNDAFRNRLITK